jgi:hypothetical protein
MNPCISPNDTGLPWQVDPLWLHECDQRVVDALEVRDTGGHAGPLERALWDSMLRSLEARLASRGRA